MKLRTHGNVYRQIISLQLAVCSSAAKEHSVQLYMYDGGLRARRVTVVILKMLQESLKYFQRPLTMTLTMPGVYVTPENIGIRCDCLSGLGAVGSTSLVQISIVNLYDAMTFNCHIRVK